MIGASQIRAARALLGLSAADLANLSGVPHRTIQRFEAAEDVPPSRGGTLDRVRNALENEGVEFFGDPVASPGVRLNRK